MGNSDYIDITGQFKTVENLKADILKYLGYIYGSDLQNDKIQQCFADIIINTMLLSKKSGISEEMLFDTVKNRLKLRVLEDSPLHDDIAEILGDAIKISENLRKH